MSKELRDALTAPQRTSLTEEASEVVAHRLRQKFGIELQISRLYVDSKEVDLYASKDDFCVIGEATTRLGKRVVIELDEKVEYIMRKKPELLKPRYVKVIYTIVALGRGGDRRSKGAYGCSHGRKSLHQSRCTPRKTKSEPRQLTHHRPNLPLRNALCALTTLTLE